MESFTVEMDTTLVHLVFFLCASPKEDIPSINGDTLSLKMMVPYYFAGYFSDSSLIHHEGFLVIRSIRFVFIHSILIVCYCN